MVTYRRTRRSLLSGLVGATAVGLAGCSSSESGAPADTPYPESVSTPADEVTDVTLLERGSHYDTVMFETKETGKYLDATLLVPEARFFDRRGEHFVFAAYEDEEGPSPQEAFALQTEYVEQNSFPDDDSTMYTIEGPLDGVETLGGGEVLVLGGDTVEVTRNE